MAEIRIGDYVGFHTHRGDDVGRIVGFGYYSLISGRWRPLRTDDVEARYRAVEVRLAVDSSLPVLRIAHDPDEVHTLPRVSGVVRNGQMERLQ